LYILFLLFFFASIRTLGSGSPVDNIIIGVNSNSNLFIQISSGNYGYDIDCSYTILSNVWDHYAITIDSSGNFNIFVNGASTYKSSFYMGGPQFTTRSHLYIGNSSSSSSYSSSSLLSSSSSSSSSLSSSTSSSSSSSSSSSTTFSSSPTHLPLSSPPSATAAATITT